LFLAEGKIKKRDHGFGPQPQQEQFAEFMHGGGTGEWIKVAAKGRTKKLRLNMHACLQLKLHHRPAAAKLAIVDTAPKEITVHLLEK
jgi:hypothetical protein